MVKDENVGALFEAFNAKYLEPEEVAQSFIFSRHFEELTGPYHAVLVGPRGSGKTTLLKMLQPAALGAWDGKRANSFREAIRYSGVFIASDISWSKQLASLGYGKLATTAHNVLVLACFTTHVLHSVLETMISRVDGTTRYRAVQLDSNAEQDLARHIADHLRLKPKIGSLLSVKQALRDRLSQIRLLANKGSLLGVDEFQAELAGQDYLHLDFIDSTSNITSAFNDVAKEQGERWALLFDELETAPDWIVQQLFSAFRVSDPKLYLKLAISPISAIAFKSLVSVDGPVTGQDHRQIPLWYTDRIDARSFCEDLWGSLTQKHGIEVNPYQALGSSVFDPQSKTGGKKINPYAPGQHWSLIFQRLRDKDRSFSNFLRLKGIDASHLDESSQYKRDAIVRKAAPIAAVRDFYLHQDQLGRVNIRKRKTSTLYAGADSIFAISEGNPRWLIGLLTPLISYLIRNGVKRVPASVQAEEIDNAAERMLALLRTIPVSQVELGSESIGLDSLIHTVGNSLHENLMEKHFTVDPKLSFVVDSHVSESIKELLSAGLNRGAVVLVEDTTARAIVGEVSGSILRLSYLLAAKFGVPLRKGKATNLSVLLSLNKPRKEEEVISGQLKLEGLE